MDQLPTALLNGCLLPLVNVEDSLELVCVCADLHKRVRLRPQGLDFVRRPGASLLRLLVDLPRVCFARLRSLSVSASEPELRLLRKSAGLKRLSLDLRAFERCGALDFRFLRDVPLESLDLRGCPLFRFGKVLRDGELEKELMQNLPLTLVELRLAQFRGRLEDAPVLPLLESLIADSEGRAGLESFVLSCPSLRSLSAWSWAWSESGPLPRGLESLDLEFCHDLQGFQDLQALRRLCVMNLGSTAGFDQLPTSLQALVVSGENWIEADFGDLARLRELHTLELHELCSPEAAGFCSRLHTLRLQVQTRVLDLSSLVSLRVCELDTVSDHRVVLPSELVCLTLKGVLMDDQLFVDQVALPMTLEVLSLSFLAKLGRVPGTSEASVDVSLRSLRLEHAVYVEGASHAVWWSWLMHTLAGPELTDLCLGSFERLDLFRPWFAQLQELELKVDTAQFHVVDWLDAEAPRLKRLVLRTPASLFEYRLTLVSRLRPEFLARLSYCRVDLTQVVPRVSVSVSVSI